MGRITSNVGLITGLPITDTVDQLMQVAGAPRDLLLSRTQGLQQQQLAVNSLSTRLLSLKFELNKLNVSDPYESRTVASQNSDIVSASLASDGKPAFGNYQVRPAQIATSQQFISQRFEDLDEVQSSGLISFGLGGFVDKGISLDQLNQGEGIQRGEIKLTDLDGNSAVIDLSLARSVDDVLDAINSNTDINITASVDDDRFKLTDSIGSGGTLSVQEVAGGTTAASLGISGISTTSSEATGTDVFDLHLETKLSSLNDGNGVRISDNSTNLEDLVITLADETTAEVDLSGATTLEDVIDAINDHEDLSGKITAAIASDGNRIELTDGTSGGGTFAVADGTTGSAATDLGLTVDASSGVITGTRLDSGLKGTLLSSLKGGQGVGPLGVVSIDDRSASASDTADLSSAETVQDVLDLLNGTNQNVLAQINSSRNGIEILDLTGESGDLQILNSDATNSADALGISVDAAQSSVNSGTLARQTLSEATLLSTLKGGQGIDASDITITDTNGVSTSLDLNATGSEAKTIGDVIDAINASSVGVQARINDSGDGILVIDTALGSGTLGIDDVSGTLAADLNLTRASETIDIDGQDTQVIDATSSYAVDLSDLDGSSTAITLDSLNDGEGIDNSDILITDSAGNSIALDLNGADAGISTIGQLIDAINNKATAAGVGLTASINESESGILLTDTAEGSENLTVQDINGTAAADLKILSTDNTTTSIDGAGIFSSQNASQSALDTLAKRINDLDSGVTASTFFDGLGYRLSINVDKTGEANEILLDTGDSGFVFEQTSSAQDALLVLGEQNIAGSGVLISSSDNNFDETINGVNLTVAAASDTSVEVTVASTDADLVSAADSFVAAYNSIRSELDVLTDFNETELTTGILFGTNEALRADTELSRLITDRYSGVGTFQSLEEVGFSVDEDGKLSLDKGKFKEAFADNPNALESLFTDETNGVIAKFNTAIDRLAGADNGALTNRSDSLQATIDANQTRLEQFNDSLDRQRERLLLQFFQLEQVIAGLQQSQTALSALQPLAPLVSTSS